jgi:hypothetical protein
LESKLSLLYHSRCFNLAVCVAAVPGYTILLIAFVIMNAVVRTPVSNSGSYRYIRGAYHGGRRGIVKVTTKFNVIRSKLADLIIVMSEKHG